LARFGTVIRLSEQIVLNENEYEVAELLSKHDYAVTSDRIAEYFNRPGIGTYYWRNSDKTRPKGKWTWYKVADIFKKLVSMDLISEYPIQYDKYDRAYFMTDNQKEQFKTVQVKRRYTPKPKGRPRKYKDNAEKQKAYRLRKSSRPKTDACLGGKF